MCWGCMPGGQLRNLGPQSRRTCVCVHGWIKWTQKDQARDEGSQSGWCPSCPDASCLRIRTLLWERNQGGDGCSARMTRRDVFPPTASIRQGTQVTLQTTNRNGTLKTRGCESVSLQLCPQALTENKPFRMSRGNGVCRHLGKPPSWRSGAGAGNWAPLKKVSV